jgi:hypothetical protein
MKESSFGRVQFGGLISTWDQNTFLILESIYMKNLDILLGNAGSSKRNLGLTAIVNFELQNNLYLFICGLFNSTSNCYDI